MTRKARDTRPEVERLQMELLRKASPAARFARARSLSLTAIQLAKRAIGRQGRGMTQTEIDLQFVRLNYGEALADAVARHLAGRSSS
jgi:hypothetical protein